MARKKQQNTKTNEEVGSVSEEKKVKRKDGRFGMKSRNIPTTLIEDRLPVGTANALTKPIYVPPDIEIAWAASPRVDDGEDLARMFDEGFDVVPLEKITSDEHKAREEGLICFRTISGFGDVEGMAGLVNYGLVLLFRPVEYGEAHRKKLIESWNNKVNGHIVGLDKSGGKRSRAAASVIEQVLNSNT